MQPLVVVWRHLLNNFDQVSNGRRLGYHAIEIFTAALERVFGQCRVDNDGDVLSCPTLRLSYFRAISHPSIPGKRISIKWIKVPVGPCLQGFHPICRGCGSPTVAVCENSFRK